MLEYLKIGVNMVKKNKKNNIEVNNLENIETKNIDLNTSKSILDKNNIFKQNEPDLTTNQILMKLLDSDNISLKTDIDNVREFTSLRLLQYICKTEKLNISKMVFKKYIEYYLKYRVSNKRKSRKEIVFALTKINDVLNQLDSTNKDPNLLRTNLLNV